MFDQTFIMEQLKKGRDIGDIAQEMADTLNAAKAQYDKEKSEADRKAKLQKEKEEYAHAIVEAVYKYLRKFHPDFLTDKEKAEFLNANDADLAAAIDGAVAMTKSASNGIEQLLKDLQDLELDKTNKNDPITTFLKKNSLL